MSSYIAKRSEKHKVEHTYSGKYHFFKVITEKGTEHEVSIKVNCICTYMGRYGVANGKICSHIMAVLKQIIRAGQIDLKTIGEDTDGNITNKCNFC